MSDAPAEAVKKKSKLPLFLALILLLGAGGAGAAWYFKLLPGTASEEVAVDMPAPPIYMDLRPAFVVNLEGPDANRFLQVEVDLMTRDQAVVEAIKTHMPAVRNSLLLLLGSQRYQSLQQREGKLALQQAVLDAINRILDERSPGLVVEEVYFSSFVMQ